MALKSALTNENKSTYDTAANEYISQNTDTNTSAGVTIAPGKSSNPMLNRTVRKFGNTTTSGEGDVLINGQKVSASNPSGGNDLGDMITVTQGMSNIKNAMRGEAYGNGNVALDETSGNILYNGGNTGLKASDYASGIDGRTAADGYSKATGDAVVRGRAYLDSKGLGQLVNWDDSTRTMSVGGINVPYQYITDDGNAMVSQSVLDKVVAQLEQNSGVKNGTALTDDIYSKYDPTISVLNDKIINRDEWKYNPQKDPAYQAYAQMYQQNAEQAYNRAMGSGGLYGTPSSYQKYQALAGYGDSMQQLSQAVPTLAQQDYQRYSDEQNRNIQALQALQQERAYEYNMRYNANENQLNHMNTDAQTNYSRRYNDMYVYPMADNELAMSDNDVTRSNVDTVFYPTLKQYEADLSKANVDAATQTNMAYYLNNIEQTAKLRGGELSTDEKIFLGLDPNEVHYVDDYDVQAMLRLYNNAQKKIALDQIASGLG